ncbi:MAG TPA: hypothetical protein VFV07_03690 [Rhizomicrobium sp.]|nr:hypothetical protein [Rhizomicrobium sp.]
MRVFLCSIALVLGFMATAWAGCTTAGRGVHCGYDLDAAKYYPDEAKKFGAGSAAYICTRDGARTAGVFATPVAAGEAGVCYFWVRNMDAKVPENEFPKRYLKMHVASGACPAQDDFGYIDDDNVPDGVFAALVTRWNTTGLLPGKGFAFPPLTAEQRKSGQVDFDAMLRTSEGRKRFKLVAVYADEFAPDTLFPSAKRAAGIDLIVTDSLKPAETYYFVVDWSDGDFRIVAVNYMISGC